MSEPGREGDVDALAERMQAVLFRLGARLGLSTLDVCTLVNTESPSVPEAGRAGEGVQLGFTLGQVPLKIPTHTADLARDLREARAAIREAERLLILDRPPGTMSKIDWLALPAVQATRNPSA